MLTWLKRLFRRENRNELPIVCLTCVAAIPVGAAAGVNMPVATARKIGACSENLG